MATNRRQFLRLGFGALGLTLRPILAQPGKAQVLLGCRSNQQGQFFFSAVSTQGSTLFDLPLPSRGHGIAASRSGEKAIVFARRPGQFFYLVDVRSGQIEQQIHPETGRHFYGHGVFSLDGERLFVTENAFATGEGRIGVYSVQNQLSKIDELPSYGIGPHEISLLDDGRTLVVANGGIKTHPDFPRVKLNLADMKPNLAYLDAENGELSALFAPPEPFQQLSMRHLAVHGKRVVLVMQYQGSPKHQPPLIAIHSENRAMRFCLAPDGIQKRLKNYCGSVVWDTSGEIFAVSSPRGGLITFWSKEGDYLNRAELPDGCGLASGNVSGEFFLSNGLGQLNRVQLAHEMAVVANSAEFFWDNHLTKLNPSWI